ncbi:MAG TPA: hypothetical protein VFL80_08940 [Thermoanaerobaculia bacterium]|nr:hypothetical protein [Thermoanaerobaculia bacterium]
MAAIIGTSIEPFVSMRRGFPFAIVIALLAACRGEPVPRDYRNNPPAMTHPVDKKEDAPSQHGMGASTPETATTATGQMLPTDSPGTATTGTATTTTGTVQTTTTTTTTRNPEGGAPENTRTNT